MPLRMRASLAALVTAAALAAVGSFGPGCQGAQADPSSLNVGMVSTGGGGSPGASSSTGASGDDATSAPGDDAGADLDASAPSGEASPDAGTTAADGGSEATADGASPGAGEGATSSPLDTGVAADAASDGLVCTNLSCTTFLDCLLGHAAEVGPCGFTVCTNFVCQ